MQKRPCRTRDQRHPKHLITAVKKATEQCTATFRPLRIRISKAKVAHRGASATIEALRHEGWVQDVKPRVMGYPVANVRAASARFRQIKPEGMDLAVSVHHTRHDAAAHRRHTDHQRRGEGGGGGEGFTHRAQTASPDPPSVALMQTPSESENEGQPVPLSHLSAASKSTAPQQPQRTGPLCTPWQRSMGLSAPWACADVHTRVNSRRSAWSPIIIGRRGHAAHDGCEGHGRCASPNRLTLATSIGCAVAAPTATTTARHTRPITYPIQESGPQLARGVPRQP
eukprot:COSAG01_NODE_1080_length_11819_cov_29.816212_14_plen_283_part_00